MLESAYKEYGADPKVVVKRWTLRRLFALMTKVKKRRDDDRRWMLNAMTVTASKNPKEMYDAMMATVASGEQQEEVAPEQDPQNVASWGDLTLRQMGGHIVGVE